MYYDNYLLHFCFQLQWPWKARMDIQGCKVYVSLLLILSADLQQYSTWVCWTTGHKSNVWMRKEVCKQHYTDTSYNIHFLLLLVPWSTTLGAKYNLAPTQYICLYTNHILHTAYQTAIFLQYQIPCTMGVHNKMRTENKWKRTSNSKSDLAQSDC